MIHRNLLKGRFGEIRVLIQPVDISRFVMPNLIRHRVFFEWMLLVQVMTPAPVPSRALHGTSIRVLLRVYAGMTQIQLSYCGKNNMIESYTQYSLQKDCNPVMMNKELDLINI